MSMQRPDFVADEWTAETRRQYADPTAGLPARSCNDPEHEARRAELRADREHGTPCLVCGAPIIDGYDHDPACPILDTVCRCGEQWGASGDHTLRLHAVRRVARAIVAERAR